MTMAETRVRVRYAETDQMGVGYHANYLVWVEVGRVEFIRQMGLDYRSMEKDENAMIAVVEATARYKAPARYDDELIVRTTLGGVGGSIVRFRYAVVRAVDHQMNRLSLAQQLLVNRAQLLCEGE